MLDIHMLNPDMRAYVIRAEAGDKARDTGIRRWGSLILTADHTLTHLYVHTLHTYTGRRQWCGILWLKVENGE